MNVCSTDCKTPSSSNTLTSCRKRGFDGEVSFDVMRAIKVLSGSSHPQLVASVCKWLALPESDVKRGQFANGETSINLIESMRAEDVFIFQSGGCAKVNDHLLELLILANACKVASARRVVAVLPYHPYSKQCKKKCRTCVATKLVTDMMHTAGIQHVITMDLHADQIEGFFTTPVDNITAQPLLAKYIMENIPDYSDAIVVSKNAGGVKRATALADKLGMSFAVIHKEQHNRMTNSTSTTTVHMDSCCCSNSVVSKPDSKMVLVGSVTGKLVILVDDLLDRAKSFVKAAKLCKENGAMQVYVCITHNVMSGDSVALINNSCIDRVITTNTVPQENLQRECDKLHVIDAAPMFAEAVRRLHNGESFSYLFNNVPF